MKKLFNVSVIVLVYSVSFAQDSVTNANAYLYNAVYKNIAAYNIRNSSFTFNGVIVSDMFRSNADFFYDRLLPDYGYRLKMDIDKSDLKYPLSSFALYKIHTYGFTFVNERGDTALSSNHWTPNNYLIALDRSNGDIKFVSGQYFISAIGDDFKVTPDNPSTLIPYLQLRAFYVGAKNITFKRKRSKTFIYEGYSNEYNRTLRIVVPIKDIEHIKVIVKK